MYDRCGPSEPLTRTYTVYAENDEREKAHTITAPTPIWAADMWVLRHIREAASTFNRMGAKFSDITKEQKVTVLLDGDWQAQYTYSFLQGLRDCSIDSNSPMRFGAVSEDDH